jgi:predicted transcriptional regulator
MPRKPKTVFGRPPLGDEAKTATIVVRVHPDLKERAQKEAKKLRRPLSNIVEQAMKRELGMLDEDAPEPESSAKRDRKVKRAAVA